ncbi:hypothetical protein F4819DRAFT_451354 [Hypoxylon fuscum]|nr:hypothetical protein F4819DRAFT_451354 [Hypoxylon fuscum]
MLNFALCHHLVICRSSAAVRIGLIRRRHICPRRFYYFHQPTPVSTLLWIETCSWRNANRTPIISGYNSVSTVRIHTKLPQSMSDVERYSGMSYVSSLEGGGRQREYLSIGSRLARQCPKYGRPPEPRHWDRVLLFPGPRETRMSLALMVLVNAKN